MKAFFLKLQANRLLNKCKTIDSLLGDLSSHSLEHGGKIAGYVYEIRILLRKIGDELGK